MLCRPLGSVRAHEHQPSAVGREVARDVVAEGIDVTCVRPPPSEERIV
jgi:hypothetical protein